MPVGMRPGLGHVHDQAVIAPAAIEGAHLSGVQVLGHEHPTGCQSVRQAAEHLDSLRKVLQHQALGDDDPRTERDGLLHDVRGPHFDLGASL
jgi:hypothetical protein